MEKIDKQSQSQAIKKPIVIDLWILVFFLSIGLLGCIFLLQHLISNERNAFINESDFILHGNKLAEGSDTLTNAVREFVLTGNPKFLQDYWFEADIVQNRDNVIAGMDKLNISDTERSLLLTAKINSDDLIATEIRAMKLILTAIGVPEDRMYPTIGEFKLSNADRSLPSKQKINLAQQILFDQNYIKTKQSIMEPIKEFQTIMKKRMRQEGINARFYTHIVMVLAGILSLLITIIIIMIIWVKPFR